MDIHFNFVFNDADNVRIIVDDSKKELFVATDIAKVLGYYEAHNMITGFEPYEYEYHTVSTAGGNQNMLVLTEPGLYHCIMRSRKPNAKEFQKWIYTIVIPSIRLYGIYIDPDTQALLAANPNIINELRAQVAELQRKANLIPLYHLVDKKRYPFTMVEDLKKDNVKLEKSNNELRSLLRGNDQILNHIFNGLGC